MRVDHESIACTVEIRNFLGESNWKRGSIQISITLEGGTLPVGKNSLTKGRVPLLEDSPRVLVPYYIRACIDPSLYTRCTPRNALRCSCVA